jgi:drug/metabolite transporter (DMT)-like permease
MNKRTGILFAMGAAFFYGVSSITGKMSYVGDGNAVTISFYRNMISVPLLFLVLKLAGVSMKITKRECLGLAILGVLGGCITGVLIYTSYQYISVGLTTCIHFSYPVILAFIYVFIFKEKLSRTKVAALILGIGGMLFFLESDAAVHPFGIFTALMSGFGYAFYLIVMDKWNLKSMNGFKLSFYCCIFSGISLFLFGSIMGYGFSGVMNSGAWVWILATAVFVSVLGNAMIPAAVNHVGPTVTGIVGILEPVTSVVMGILLLGEPFGLRSMAGAAAVLGAAILLSMEKPEIIERYR